MYFDSLAALWAMGGHGVYVWSAYAISFAVLLALPLTALKRQRQLKREILRQLQQEDD